MTFDTRDSSYDNCCGNDKHMSAVVILIHDAAEVILILVIDNIILTYDKAVAILAHANCCDVDTLCGSCDINASCDTKGTCIPAVKTFLAFLKP